VCGDAAEAPWPEGPLAVWLFNPFGPEVLLPVLARLRGRDAHLVYVVPRHLVLVRSAGWDEIARGSEDPWPWVVLARSPP
jgi:hypothetical protein